VSVVTLPAYDGTDVTLRHISFGPPALDNRTRLILARHRARSARR
jgi:phage head maturation protease